MNRVWLKFCGECLYNYVYNSNFDVCIIFLIGLFLEFFSVMYIKDKMVIVLII